MGVKYIIIWGTETKMGKKRSETDGFTGFFVILVMVKRDVIGTSECMTDNFFG
jgi:hypothetical protein